MKIVDSELLNPKKANIAYIQLGLWSLYGLLYRIVWLGYTPPPISWFVIYTLSGLFVTSILCFLYWSLREKSFALQVLWGIISSIILAMIWRIGFNIVDFDFYGRPPFDSDERPIYRYLYGGMSSLIQLLAWSAGYLLCAYYIKYVKQREKSLTLELQAKQAKIRELHFQINPHLIFNALNSLDTTLLKGNIAEGRDIVHKLSAFMRQTLKSTPQLESTLLSELESNRRYLEIEKIRFTDKLEVEINCSPAIENFVVPTLILQPLVENAIKHSIEGYIHGGKIMIDASSAKNKLIICVSNQPFKPAPQPTSKNIGLGVGLENIRSRLHMYYGNKAKLLTQSDMMGKYAVEIIIEIDARQGTQT